MTKRILTIAILALLLAGQAFAQRTTDKLDRGLVAVPSGSGSFVSWRIFGEEYYDTEYNLYRNGTLVNPKPLKVSNYTDPNGKAGAKYQVAAVVRGVEQERSAEVTRLSQQYIQFAVKSVTSRSGSTITDDYTINDIALADVDGDGVSEFIMKRNYKDGSSVSATAFHLIECYNIRGDRLWWIDLGPNMVSGPDEQYDAVGYDWDGDGKAEILMRGADNMIIHHADGTTTNIGNMNVNTRNTVLQQANMTYTNTGNEYLLYLEGATGKPYPIGANGALWMTYPLPRGNANDWGDGYGHRSTKHYFGAPFLDGRKPFIFLGRGCYTKHHMKAFSVDPQTHRLTQYWEFNGTSWPYSGQGYHNFGIADVDWDGRDEICFGSMVIDDNGKGLSSTGFGHGDAQHCSDFDPFRHGQEIFACNEDQPSMNYRNATTSKIYYRLVGTGDDGRALCGNFSNSYPGAIGHSSQSGTISCVADKPIANGPGGFTNNFRIYWDGDLLEEGLDGRGTEGACAVYKADGSQVFSTEGTKNCNWTKNTPSATGDVLGDWREEIIVRTSDNSYVRVYTTNIATQYRNYTLWHDHQYRQGMVWESVGYNMPPHASYFIGELEGITQAPPPLTMTGRVETKSISSEHNGQHVIVCEWADTEVDISDGAEPWVATFYVPSWIQGTNSTATNGNPVLNRKYYTCNVSGGALAGEARLVKQGDGTLNLPKVDMRHTGNTDIWAGTLNFDGTMKSTTLRLDRFAELNSDGGEYRCIKMAYDAKLRPGRANNRGTLTTDSLLMGYGARVVFDIYSDHTADQLNAVLLTIETKSWQYGPQYMTPVFEFVVQGGTDPEPGRYALGRIDEVKGLLDNIRIEGLGNNVKGTLSRTDDGQLFLDIETMGETGTIVWTGSQGNVWDLATTENFQNASGSSDTFITDDNVLFTDDAQQTTVSLSGELQADSVIVNSTKNYTFQGTGALVGTTTLVKRGTGMLTVGNENSYTGGTRISGGILAVTSLSNSVQTKGNLGSMQTSPAKFVIENGAELRTTAAVTNGSAIQLLGEEGGVINNTQDFFVERPITGTVLTKKGGGWMKLNVSNTGLGKLVVAAGTVQCINTNTPAKTVELQGGTLRENTSTSYPINIPKNKKGSWYMANRSDYSNKITGEGELTAYCVTEKGTNYYATRTPIRINLSDFEGTLKPTSSLDDPAVLRFTMDIGGGMPRGTMSIDEKVQVQNSGKTYRIGKVSGKGSLGGSCTFSNGANVGANTWQIGWDSDNYTTTVFIAGNANFVKVGSNKITWSGANTNSGTTLISEGELAVNSSSSLGTGALTVASGAMLTGVTNDKNPLSNSSVTVNGVLRPGQFEEASSGNMFFNNKPVTIAKGGQLVVNARLCANATSNGGTSLQGVSTLTVNGVIRVRAVKNNMLQVGDSIRIFSAAHFAGNPTFEFEGGIDWDTSRISEGLLFVRSISDGIDSVKLSADSPADIYDTRGRLVRRHATTTVGLPAGIYVVRGRKLIVR